VNLDETTSISTTTIGTGSDSDNVAYSATGRTDVPFRVVGFIESTQATAGTWATSPSTLQGAGGNALSSMSSLGYGQTWQAVSRTSGTTYYNTTGKPICVVAYATGMGTNNYIAISVGGIAVAHEENESGTSTTLTTTAIVPVNDYYVITQSGGSSAHKELR